MDPKTLPRVIKEHEDRWQRQASAAESAASKAKPVPDDWTVEAAPAMTRGVRDLHYSDVMPAAAAAAPRYERFSRVVQSARIFDGPWSDPQADSPSYWSETNPWNTVTRRVTTDWDTGEVIADEDEDLLKDASFEHIFRSIPAGPRNILTELTCRVPRQETTSKAAPAQEGAKDL